jgi:ribosome maturation factor RimP
MIEPTLRDMGFELVLVRVMGDRRRTLQVLAEPIDRSRLMTVEDCAEISHALSAVLDVADPIKEPYSLEVSSPGIDRPLTRLADFEDWKGFEARVTLAEPLNGRKQFSGVLQGAGQGDAVHLAGKDGQDYVIPFASIHSAKLLLTDELIASTAPLSTEGADTIQTVED